jgi:hypothetical protein
MGSSGRSFTLPDAITVGLRAQPLPPPYHADVDAEARAQGERKNTAGRDLLKQISAGAPRWVVRNLAIDNATSGLPARRAPPACVTHLLQLERAHVA